jgi:hypothetical protein
VFDSFRLPFLSPRVDGCIGRQRPLINNNKSFETLGAAFPRLATAVMNFRGCRDGDRKPPDLGAIANSKRQLTRCVLRRGLFLGPVTTR